MFWNGSFYQLNQGIPTGAKHCVPLANILLTFIIRELLDKDEEFKKMFYENLKIWQRFIDDCLGMFLGRDNFFATFYEKLEAQFRSYDLELTSEQSNKEIVMLDLEIYILNNQLHTRESRKETAANSYLRYGSAHPGFTFKGIVRSQMYRLRRLCSRQEDYDTAINGLRERCKNSDYDMQMVEDVLKDANNIERQLSRKHTVKNEDIYKIRWVTMAKSSSEEEIEQFSKAMNTALRSHNVGFEIIKTTAPTIGNMLFNNSNNSNNLITKKCTSKCRVCETNGRGDRKQVVSKANGATYSIDENPTCCNSGIYMITCKCKEQYVGKTTVTFTQRYKEHWNNSKNTTVNHHMKHCTEKPTADEVNIQFLENVWNRGKYSLSEREYLWNRRMKASINIQKTLKTL